MAGCTQCGTCCKRYGMRLEASPLDIARWRRDQRQDILRHVGLVRENGAVTGGLLWVDAAGQRLEACPFLQGDREKYFCAIQDAKPEVCTGHFCEKYY